MSRVQACPAQPARQLCLCAEAMPDRVGGGLGTAVHAGLEVDVGDVPFDGAHA